MSTTDAQGTKVITPEAIASYPTLAEPQAGPQGGEAKYSLTLIFPKGTDLTALKTAVKAAIAKKYGNGKVPKLRLPFRSDPEDIEAKGYPEGSAFMSVRTNQKPTVVSTVPDPNNGGKPTVIDPSWVYAGSIVRASLTAFCYDQSGNKGVTFGLNNVQFVRDCAPEERLDGRRAATDEFAADENAVADLSDLDGFGGSDDEDDPLADLG